MVKRYENPIIEKIFRDEAKLQLWQDTEMAVIKARVNLNMIAPEIYDQILAILQSNPIDVEWWKKRDEEIHHDLNAFIDERIRHLPGHLHQYFHKNLTSYDTEEPAFAQTLVTAFCLIMALSKTLEQTLKTLALKHRHTIMNGRTHGQEAEMQSFGARCLTWLADYRVAREALEQSLDNLKYSKLSGAIGKYGSLDPKIEEEALRILVFTPFYGATQIMPRILYAPIAQNLCNLVVVIDKIGMDIRLASRSGRPLLQEPFKKKQKGSSAMPHKKNTIRTEQLEGMARMAKGYMIMITDNIKTWEERAIEQSCVERVAWPDLFHVTAQSLKVLDGVLNGLTVYSDNMLQELYESRGVYASSEVKEFLKERLNNDWIKHEDAYRIVQLACFNVFEPGAKRLAIREKKATSFTESLELLQTIGSMPPEKIISIEKFIPEARLRVSDSLDLGPQQIDIYNQSLRELFSQDGVIKEWKKLFTPEFLLKNEDFLYQQILGI